MRRGAVALIVVGVVAVAGTAVLDVGRARAEEEHPPGLEVSADEQGAVDAVEATDESARTAAFAAAFGATSYTELNADMIAPEPGDDPPVRFTQ